MIGSNGSEGRCRATGALKPASRADRDGEWTLLCGKRCFICDRLPQPKALCEDRERVVRYIRLVEPPEVPPIRLGNRTICKDCCIRTMDGHHCPWWNLCWRG